MSAVEIRRQSQGAELRKKKKLLPLLAEAIADPASLDGLHPRLRAKVAASTLRSTLKKRGEEV